MAELPLLSDDRDLLGVVHAASDEDLAPLVEYILGADGTGRWTSQLQETDSFKRHKPRHGHYAGEIAAEIQMFGGNSFANVARGGKGVPYREIVDDVGAKFGVKLSSETPVAQVEAAIRQAAIAKAWEKMSDEEKREVYKAAGEPVPSHLPKAIPVAVLQALIAGSGFAAYKFAAIIANAVAKALLGRGLTFAGNQTLMKSISAFAGPVGWAVTVVWTAVDLAGPAFRVTIPCVFHVGYLREKQRIQVCRNGHANSKDAKFCVECGVAMSGIALK